MPRQPDTAAHLPAKIPETNDAAAWPAPTSDNGRIRRVTRAELGAMARILAQAFYDDPLMRWMVPNDALRLQRLERVFGISSHRVWLPQTKATSRTSWSAPAHGCHRTRGISACSLKCACFPGSHARCEATFLGC